MHANPKFDEYISKAQPFAQPILKHLRSIVHATCPQVEEKMKWSMPFFDYKGQMMCSMAAFKQHVVFGFWKAPLMHDEKNIFITEGESAAMGQLGRITSLKDLPSDSILKKYIKEAMALNDTGVKWPTGKKTLQTKSIELPDYFATALNKQKKAKATFEKMPPSHQKEYLEWITEAKTELTRQKRISTALEWLTEGKSRNWQYGMKK